MRLRLASLLFLTLTIPALAQYTQPLPTAEPPYYRVRYEPSTETGQLPYAVSYTIWLPPGVKTLRGVIVHQHGCGEGACKAGRTAAFDLHWQALARQHECALLGPSYEQPQEANCGLWCDPRNGSDQKFQQALADLAAQTKHPEIATAPWALWGHSGGAAWVGTMLLLHPERIAAVWMRSGTPRFESKENPSLPKLEITPAVAAVPLMCNLGTKEGITVTEGRFSGLWKNLEPVFLQFRAAGSLAAVSVDPVSSHDCGNQRYLAIPWFDACLTARLPEKPGQPLKPMPTKAAWLAPLLGQEAQPAAKFTGDVAKAVWLPNERVAKAWTEYERDAAIGDSTPPPAPTKVTLSADGTLTWHAEADLESGLAAFVIERDGKELARVPQKPVGAFGRQIFQNNSYSDTPAEPLVPMQFIDKNAKPGEKHEYRVRAVNSVGMESAPSAPAAH